MSDAPVHANAHILADNADDNILNQSYVASFLYSALRIILKLFVALLLMLSFILGCAFLGIGLTAICNDSGQMDPHTMGALVCILAPFGAAVGAVLGVIAAVKYFISNADPIVEIQRGNLFFFCNPFSENIHDEVNVLSMDAG